MKLIQISCLSRLPQKHLGAEQLGMTVFTDELHNNMIYLKQTEMYALVHLCVRLGDRQPPGERCSPVKLRLSEKQALHVAVLLYV